jgi:ketopantoate reductase
MLNSETSLKPRVCVVGCGAIGGLLAARMIDAGQDVQVIERGAQLEAIKERGLTLTFADSRPAIQVPVRASGTFDGEQQDIIFLAVKAHQIAAIAEELKKIMHSDSVLVTLQNGLPWWYFQLHGGPYDGQHLKSLDPQGEISRHISPAQILGCVAYPAAEVSGPGVIHHIEGDRFPLGALSASQSLAAEKVVSLLEASGFRSRVIPDIRNEVWLKLWGVLAFNPISMLTGATLREICRNEQTRELVINMMHEAETVAQRLGVSFRVPLQKRIAGAERVGAHKTSTLQDMESGRPTELEAILGSVIELAEFTGVDAPSMTAVYACCKLLEQKAIGQRPENLQGRPDRPPFLMNAQ